VNLEKRKKKSGRCISVHLMTGKRNKAILRMERARITCVARSKKKEKRRECNLPEREPEVYV